MPDNAGRMLSLSECAELLGLSAVSLYNLRHVGADLPPSYKYAGRVRYRRSDVLAWLETQREQPRAAAGA